MTEMKTGVVVLGFARPDLLEDRLREVSLHTSGSEVEITVIVDGAPERGLGGYSNIHEQNRKCAKLARNFEDHANGRFSQVHEQNRGINGILQDLDELFERYSSLLVIEDDVVLSPIVFRSLDRLNSLINSDVGVACISLFNYRTFSPGGTNFWWKSSRFTCWGWYTTAERWRTVRNYDSSATAPSLKKATRLGFNSFIVRDIPSTETIESCEKVSWDLALARQVIDSKMSVLIPNISLSLNAGTQSGVHGRTGSFRGKVFPKKLPSETSNVQEMPVRDLRFLGRLTHLAKLRIAMATG